MKLFWNDYKYYPYEKGLAARELTALFGDVAIKEDDDGYRVDSEATSLAAERLTYFSRVHAADAVCDTAQARLERAGNGRQARQATRYSVHGLHEYKGKFNPQVARAVLNIFGAEPGARVLDPFCGSGTTLVEASHLGCATFGTDINPLATFIARAKLEALSYPAASLWAILAKIRGAIGAPVLATAKRSPEAAQYLDSWFDPAILEEIERVRRLIEDYGRAFKSFFLCLASDLLREYSGQEPADLRIRRRRSPLPNIPFSAAFFDRCELAIVKLQSAQTLLPSTPPTATVVLGDVRSPAWPGNRQMFDAAVTSPPYAMALPYIDTQRLSLVWLGLVEPGELGALEAQLIGSRELRGTSRRDLASGMQQNSARLTGDEVAVCLELQSALGSEDGFRRRAVPVLLYRYFTGMRDAFANVRSSLKPGAKFGLIVGENRTTLGGKEYQLDTPLHLANLAGSTGWCVSESIPLQTYQRYGLHAANAIAAETLLILQR